MDEQKGKKIKVFAFGAIALTFLVMIVISFVDFINKNSNDSSMPTFNESTPSASTKSTTITANEETPNEPSIQEKVIPLPKFKIISEEKNETVSKCNVNVQLDSEISEEQIEAIGNKIRETRTEYKRLYIFYLLPKMKVGSGCWATSHFLPDMKVEFTGFIVP